MAKQDEISFFEFKEKYSDEDKCRDHLFHLRWPDGFICPNAETMHIIQSKTGIRPGEHVQAVLERIVPFYR